MTPSNSGIAFEPRPLVAQEAEHHRSGIPMRQTFQEDMDHEIHAPRTCDKYYKVL